MVLASLIERQEVILAKAAAERIRLEAERKETEGLKAAEEGERARRTAVEAAMTDEMVRLAMR